MAKYVRKSKEELRSLRLRQVLTAIALAAVVITAAVLFFRQRVRDEFGGNPAGDIETAAVSLGSIRTTVSGTGSLASEDVLEVEVSALVTVEEVLVEAGDPVDEGQLLAVVEESSVISALQQLQSRMAELDQELGKAEDDAAASTIQAGVSGRVKAVLAQPGEDVAAVMAEHGALVILSLDGKMSVKIPAGELTRGQEVLVEAGEGMTYPGTVEAVAGDVATVTLTDDGPLWGQTVTVNGEVGTLEIHAPLKITGFAGTVNTVSAKENAKVTGYTQLLTLKDTAWSANYDRLLKDRRQMEDAYQALVKLLHDGGLLSPMEGTVLTVNDSEEKPAELAMTMTAGTEAADVLDNAVLLTLDPGLTASVTITVDETDIQSLQVGQEAAVTLDSIGEERFQGTVTQIHKTGTTASGVTGYTAVITLDKTRAMLSGMTADVAVTIQGVENALIVPADAVRRTSAISYVYTTLNPETGELGGMVEVTTGMTNGEQTEILSGLAEGDTVYYTPKDRFNFMDFFASMGNMGGGQRPGNMGSMPAMPGMPGQ